MSYPLVSIGIPVYNAEKYVERCARSIFEQTYKDLEIIFVSDCSPDRSVEIINETLLDYPERLNQVKFIRHDKNRGVSVTRNTVIEHSTGDFLSFVDADDYLLPNATELLVNKQIETNADLVSGTMCWYNEKSKHDYKTPNYSSSDEMLLDLFDLKIYPGVCARIFRRSILKDNLVRFIPGLRIGEDWQFLTNYVRYIQSVRAIDEVIYIYDFSNTNSASHTETDTRMYNQWCMNAVSLMQDIKDYKNSDSINKSIDNCIARRLDKGFRMASKYHRKRVFEELVRFYLSLNIKPSGRFLFRYLSFGNKPNYYLFITYTESVKIIRMIQHHLR